jgi:hypothetical protein
MTHSSKPLSRIAFNKMTLTTFCKMTLDKRALGKMTLGRMTPIKCNLV